MTLQGRIHLSAECLRVLMQHTGTFFKGDTHGAIAVVRRMAGGLVGKQIDMYLFFYGIFQKVYHITVIGDRNRRTVVHCLSCPCESLRQRIRHTLHPALMMAGFDT